MEIKYKEIHTASDFWEAVENDSNMIIKTDITLSFLHGRNLRHYSAEIISGGKGAIRIDENICLFACLSGRIKGVLFFLYGTRVDDYAVLARLCKWNAVIEDCHFILKNKEAEKNAFLFRNIEDGAKLHGNTLPIGFSFIKNRKVDISFNYEPGTRKQKRKRWDEFHKENFHIKTKGCFLEIKNNFFEADNVEKMLYKNNKIQIERDWNICNAMPEIEEIIDFDVHTRKLYLKNPDFISGGKYEVLWVKDEDKLLGYNVGQHIEYQENPYKVIDVVFYEDEEEELGYYHKIVLQHLNCGSMYWYAPNGVFRYSDHWGKLKDYEWDLKFYADKKLQEIILGIDEIFYLLDKKEYLAMMEEYYDFQEKMKNKTKILGFCAWEDFKQINQENENQEIII